MKMKPGEKAEVAIQPQYAFGDSASKQPLAVVPPCATVVYTVELVEMIKVRSIGGMCEMRRASYTAAVTDIKAAAGRSPLLMAFLIRRRRRPTI